MRNALLKAACAAIVIIACVGCVCVIRPDLFKRSGDDAHLPEAVQTSLEITDPIAQFRIERQQLRSMQLAELDEMMNSPSVSSEMALSAENEKLDILRRAEQEETVGSILRAMGFEGAAASCEGGTVTVLLYSSELGEEEIAIITQQIVDLTDASCGDIKIIPIN